MRHSIGLGDSYFPTRISEEEVGVLVELRVSHLEIRLLIPMERYFLLKKVKRTMPEWA